MKFKTNAKCMGCKTRILNAVNEKFPDMQWDLDLQNADKVLECHGIPDNSETAQKIVDAIEETGFKGSFIPAE